MGEEIPKKEKRNPADYNAKLASLSFAKELNNPENPAMQVLSGEFTLARSCMKPLHEFFIVKIDGKIVNKGLQPVMDIFDEFGKYSPSIDGYGRQQQESIATNSSRPVYQSMQPLQDDNKPGLVSRVFSFIGGSKTPRQESR